jgi:hypothetical protein
MTDSQHTVNGAYISCKLNAVEILALEGDRYILPKLK